MRSFIQLPSLNGVAAGQTATLALPVGPKYHKLQLQYGTTAAGGANQANTEAAITAVRLKVNGKVQRTFSAKQLDSINAYNNRAFQGNGYLEIFLSEPWARVPQGEDLLAWGTGDLSSSGTFQAEVDIAAGATAPTFIAHAEVEYVSAPMGSISKWYGFNQPVAAVGITTNAGLPKSSGSYREIHAFPVGANDISDVKVTVDQVIRLQGTLADLTTLLKSYYVTPQNGMFHIDFARTDRIGDALSMSYVNNKGTVVGAVQDLRVDWDMAAANSFPFVAVVLGARD